MRRNISLCAGERTPERVCTELICERLEKTENTNDSAIEGSQFFLEVYI